MKLTVDRAVLVRELQFLRGAVETSTTIPILSHVLAEAEGDRLTLTATNLDLAIRGVCAAKSICGRLTLLQNCSMLRALPATLLTKNTHS